MISSKEFVLRSSNDAVLKQMQHFNKTCFGTMENISRLKKIVQRCTYCVYTNLDCNTLTKQRSIKIKAVSSVKTVPVDEYYLI